MNKTNRVLAFTIAVIWAPVLYGWAHYPELPARMATHWGFNNQVNGWMPKAMAVYGIPVLMTLLQLLLVGITRLNANHKGEAVRFERLLYAIMPTITVILYFTTIQANLGSDIDIRRVAIIVVAMMFMGMGNYLPTVPAGYNRTLNGMHKAAANPRTWPRVARAMGYTMVGGSLLMIASLFAPPMVSVAALAIAVVLLLVVSWWGYRLSVRQG
ncbi:DUF1648 domain-containing protein [uncultured Lacticaseibacillus sp.]|uniref:DUF1648 domain-containing protein n=1 Tax=uncultured Lacticaseibacillus sp. TaxID=2775882 RepID=UPI002591E9EC|nr:DUF1648 domain-containing protein [uncultured Lacticaseibacillus sp.]